MNEIQWLQKLNARIETPAVDVTARVIRQILHRQNSPDDSRPMWLAAFVSSAAAALVLMLAVQSWNGMHDPFSDLLSPLMTGFQ